MSLMVTQDNNTNDNDDCLSKTFEELSSKLASISKYNHISDEDIEKIRYKLIDVGNLLNKYKKTQFLDADPNIVIEHLIEIIQDLTAIMSFVFPEIAPTILTSPVEGNA